VLGEVMAFCEASASKLLVLHTAASRVGAMDLGCTMDGGIEAALGADVILNLGADEIEIPAGPFVVYQGSHGDRGAHRADVILPGAAWVEEPGIFVNMEGRPQMANRAAFPPGEARENWAILRALSATLDKTLPFDSLAALRLRMVEAAPDLGGIDKVPENAWTPVARADMSGGDFVSAVREHYLGNPVQRASEIMAELARLSSERTPALAAE
jgi:NADH-quinone oxidoreductase subunit G